MIKCDHYIELYCLEHHIDNIVEFIGKRQGNKTVIEINGKEVEILTKHLNEIPKMNGKNKLFIVIHLGILLNNMI